MQTVKELRYVSTSPQAELLNCWNDPSTEDKLFFFHEAHVDKQYKIWVDTSNIAATLPMKYRS